MTIEDYLLNNWLNGKKNLMIYKNLVITCLLAMGDLLMRMIIPGDLMIQFLVDFGKVVNIGVR